MQFTLLPGIFSGSVWQIITNSSTFGIFILLVLAIMSLVSWIIIIHKWRHFKSVDHDNLAFIQQFRRNQKLGDAIGQAKSHQNSPLSGIYLEGLRERNELIEHRNQGGGLQESQNPLTNDDFEIIEMTMERSLTEELSKLEKQVVFLATTGSSAPFLGLLGTVVGIMDSFWSIGERGSASLAVVAPGIAEALLATIVGLGAAIPAVIAYNWANNKMKYFNDRSTAFMLEFLARAKKESM